MEINSTLIDSSIIGKKLVQVLCDTVDITPSFREISSGTFKISSVEEREDRAREILVGDSEIQLAPATIDVIITSSLGTIVRVKKIDLVSIIVEDM